VMKSNQGLSGGRIVLSITFDAKEGVTFDVYL
jgi:hypothetical protein